jgi:hypothetical protein
MPRPYHTDPARKALALWAAVCVLMFSPDLAAEDSKPSEYQVKAAYLYNFGRFVEWPSKSTSSKGNAFTICVLGQDPFGPALEATLAHETIDGANVVAKRVSKAQDAGGCRILFISAAEEGSLREIMAALDKLTVLTVSDMSQFTRRGGMIQFSLEGNRVRFEVNLTAAERAGLVLSSQLLKLALSVKRNTTKE